MDLSGFGPNSVGPNCLIEGDFSSAGGHHNPPKWLKPGDVVEVEVPEIGVLRNGVVDEA